MSINVVERVQQLEKDVLGLSNALMSMSELVRAIGTNQLALSQKVDIITAAMRQVAEEEARKMAIEDAIDKAEKDFFANEDFSG